MKVILTEGQLNQIIQEEVILEGFLSSLLKLNNMDSIVKKIAIALIYGAISFGAVPKILDKVEQNAPSVAGSEAMTRDEAIKKIKMLYQNVKNKEAQVTGRMKSSATDANFVKKAEALKSYMEMAAKNQNYDPETIQISPEAMIEACNQTGFDLPLLIAQAHLESCFGLTPRAKRTNSVFSVGSYDNGKNAATYATQNDCILPYIKLIQGKYLNGKTVDDILKPGAFVNGLNKRYASDKSYEKKVRNIRNNIISKYPILAS